MLGTTVLCAFSAFLRTCAQNYSIVDEGGGITCSKNIKYCSPLFLLNFWADFDTLLTRKYCFLNRDFPQFASISRTFASLLTVKICEHCRVL